MPDVRGQPHPWERAGCERGTWLRLFDRLTAEWIVAAGAVRALYPPAEDPARTVQDESDILRRADVAGDIAADWRSSIDGDGPTIRSLLQRYRIDASR